MKKQKRVLSLILTLMMVLTMLPSHLALADEHVHTEDCDYKIETHVHTAECGHTVEEGDQTAADAEVLAVQALIDALPSVETVTEADCDAVLAAHAQYNSLSEEKKAQITGAEVIEALMARCGEPMVDLAEGACAHTHVSDTGYCFDCETQLAVKYVAGDTTNWLEAVPTDLQRGSCVTLYADAEMDISAQWYSVHDWTLYLNGHKLQLKTGEDGEGDINQFWEEFNGTDPHKGLIAYGTTEIFSGDSTNPINTSGNAQLDGALIVANRDLKIHEGVYLTLDTSCHQIGIVKRISLNTGEYGDPYEQWASTVQYDAAVWVCRRSEGSKSVTLDKGVQLGRGIITNNGEDDLAACLGDGVAYAWKNDTTITPIDLTAVPSGTETTEDEKIVTYGNMLYATHRQTWLVTVDCPHLTDLDGSLDANDRCKYCGYIRCLDHKDQNGNSLFQNGKCTKCGYTCPHKTEAGQTTIGNDAKCTVCGVDCPHETYNENGTCAICGGGCKHLSVNNETGKCTVCAHPFVMSLRIGDTVQGWYDSFNAAHDAIPKNGSGTVTLYADQSGSLSLGNYSNKTVTLDLNGHTVNGEVAAKSGTIYVITGKPGGAILNTCYDYNNAVLHFYPGVTVNGYFDIVWSASDKTVWDFLPPNSAFAKKDASGEFTMIQVASDEDCLDSGPYRIIAHTHSFNSNNTCACGMKCTHAEWTNGACSRCGYACTHKNGSGASTFDENCQCTICKLIGKVEVLKGSAAAYCATLDAAFAMAGQDATIKLLSDITETKSAGGWALNGGTGTTMDLNGHNCTLTGGDFALSGKVLVKNSATQKGSLTCVGTETKTQYALVGGEIQIDTNISVNNVKVQNGGKLNAKGEIGLLNVQDGGEAILTEAAIGQFIADGGITKFKNCTAGETGGVKINGGQITLEGGTYTGLDSYTAMGAFLADDYYAYTHAANKTYYSSLFHKMYRCTDTITIQKCIHIDDEGESAFSDAVCGVCGYICTHKDDEEAFTFGEQNVCTFCGYQCTHKDTAGQETFGQDGRCTVCGRRKLIDYLDQEGVVAQCSEYQRLTPSSRTLNNGWYVVEGEVTIDDPLSIADQAEVHLILCDGAVLRVKGIKSLQTSSEGVLSSLSIYAQSKGNAVGKLISTGYLEEGVARGIKVFGDLAINGGDITANTSGITEAGASKIAVQSLCGDMSLRSGVKLNATAGDIVVNDQSYGDRDSVGIAAALGTVKIDGAVVETAAGSVSYTSSCERIMTMEARSLGVHASAVSISGEAQVTATAKEAALAKTDTSNINGGTSRSCAIRVDSGITMSDGALTLICGEATISENLSGTAASYQIEDLGGVSAFSGGSVKLSRAYFGGGFTLSNQTLQDILYDNTYGCKTNSGWLGADSSSLTVSKCTVQLLPLTQAVITGDTSYTYGEDVTLTVSATKADGVSATPTYTWYRVEGDGADVTETEIANETDAELTVSLPNVGTYRYKAKATVDGYSREAAVYSVTVNPAEITGVSVEQTQTLIYNGQAQTATVEAKATTVNHQTAVYRYATEKSGVYGLSVPSFQNAGEYTVYYTVEAPNHSTKGGHFTVEIQKKRIAPRVTASNKTYDATSNAQVRVEFDGTADGEVLVLDTDYSAEARFSDANAEENKRVTVELELLDTTKANNYVLSTDTADTRADIHPKTLSIKGVSIADKDYDGKDTATVRAVEFDGLVSGETLQIDQDYTASGTFADAQVGAEKNVDVSVALRESSVAKNYTLSEKTHQGKGNIRALAATAPDFADRSTAYTGDAITHEPIEVPFRGVTGVSYTYIGKGDTVYASSSQAPSRVGTYTVTATFTMDKGYTQLDPKSATLTITKAINAWSTEPQISGWTYGQNANAAVAVANFGAVKTAYKRSDAQDADYTETVPENAGTYKVRFTVEGTADYQGLEKVLNMTIAPKPVTGAQIGDFEAMTYTGEVQTPTATVTLDGQAVTGAWSTVTNVQDTTTFTASGNYSGTIDNQTTGMAKAIPTESETKKTTAQLRRGRALSEASVVQGDMLGVDQEAVLGTFAWTEADRVLNSDETVEMKFTPSSSNYEEVTLYVAVKTYVSGGSGGSVSKPSSATVKNEDGSSTTTKTDSSTGTVTETTTKTDGSTNTTETQKDGTVTTTEKDKDGNITTTVEKPNGTSTVTEKKQDGSERVTETDENGTVTTTEKDQDGNTTVTKETADGNKITEEKRADGTVVKTEQSQNGETTSEIIVPTGKTSEVVIPIDPDASVSRVIVTDQSGNRTEITDFERTDSGVKIGVAESCHVEVISEAQPTRKTFADVHGAMHWAAAYIDYVYQNGLMNGISEEMFAPDDTLTRGMLATILYRAEGSPSVNKSIPFGDVAADCYCRDAIIWAEQNGIVQGVTETEFAPEDSVTREQIATMFYRYAQYKEYDISVAEDTNLLSYTDFDQISAYAITPMQYAVGIGLIQGKTESTLNPQDCATRAEAAAILQRWMTMQH